jgi:hypothetical protein
VLETFGARSCRSRARRPPRPSSSRAQAVGSIAYCIFGCV